MASHTYRSGLVLGLAVGVFALGPFSAVRAQSLSDGWKALDRKYYDAHKLYPKLFKGEPKVEPGDKQQVEAIDVFAKYATYRVCLQHLEEKPGQIDKAFKEFEGDLHDITQSKPYPQALANIYREKVRIHALEVIQHPNAEPVHKIHKIYNARILAKVAELGEGKLHETLLAVLADPAQNDAVHYYALRGLRTLLALIQPEQMPPLLTKEEEGKCAEAIIAFLERKPNLPAEPSKEELDGFRVLRREGVRALAQVHTPSFNDKIRPALVLARFAGEDGRIVPPPRIDERLEAAMGLARMRTAQNKDYQPDYAASMIGKFLGAFGVAANGEKEKPVLERQRPWKIDAVHMNEALATLKADSGKNAYVAQVVDRGMRMLQNISQGADAKAEDLSWFSSAENAAPSKELFKGAADSVVKPAQPAEAPEK